MHAAEIECAFNNLDSKKTNWQTEDRQTSQTLAAFFANFIKTGNPNGKGVPSWPEFGRTKQVMVIDAVSKSAPGKHRTRYEFLDSLTGK